MATNAATPASLPPVAHDVQAAPVPSGTRIRLALSLAGSGLLALAAWGLLKTYVFTYSEHAVVTGRVTTIRSPIEGELNPRIELGALVERGAALVTVVNDRVDTSRLLELKATIDTLNGSIAAETTLLAQLRRLSGGFLAAADTYQASRVAQLKALTAQSEARVLAAEARAREASLRQQRTGVLMDSGLSSQATLEQASLDKAVAEGDLEVAARGLEAAKLTASSARAGVNLETSGALANDKPYSRQRLDELTLHVATNERDVAQNSSKLSALEEQLAGERERVARLSRAELASPVRSRVLRTLAGTGEHVSKGQPLLQLAECSSGFVTASVSRRSFDRLRVGMRATLRLDGTGERYDGSVVQLIGQLAASDESVPSRLQIPEAERSRGYGVVLSFEQLGRGNARECKVGQTGEVRFDALGFLR